jgi:cytochrome c biogenesis protein CcmG/thiol:disulfide interchange protein DsbE
MTRRFAAVLLVAIVLPLAACSTASSVARAGAPAPPIQGPTLDGGTFDLATLRGRPVVVNFWASWCIPCREEFALFKAELQAHAAEGLAIVGVLFKDEPEPARKFVADVGATWPTVLDPDGRLAAAYRVVAPPQSYFIDRDGVIRSLQIGQATKDDFDRQYQAIAR